MKKSFFPTLFFLLFAGALLAQPAPAPKILFILDASGSMWQKIDGEFKIAIAKSVLQKLVDGLHADTHTGLVAYGHNRKSDCGDIETLLPLAAIDKSAFASKLGALNPQGMTPIAGSVEHALALAGKESGAVTCILVSDGLETCKGNACELVQQAKSKGVQITMHVIGFGLAEKDLSSLECIAQAGDGQYFAADNAEGLGKALEKSVEQAPADGGYLSIGAMLEGKPTDVTIKVFKKGEPREIAVGRTYEDKSTNPRVILLPAGTYEVNIEAIKIDSRPVQILKDLVVAERDTLHRVVEFAQSTASIKVTRNGALSDALIHLYKAGTREAVTQTRSYRGAGSNPAVMQVPPGVYDVEIKALEISGAPIHRFEKQELKPGSTLSLEREFASGELKIGARQGTALVDATVGIYAKTSKQSTASGRTYQSDSSNPKTFILEPGIYRVELKPVKPQGLAPKTFEAEVKAGGVTEKTGEW